MSDFSIDIETLGTRTNSFIFQIACVRFDRKTGDVDAEFSMFISAPDNFEIPATLGTIKFWATQPHLAKLLAQPAVSLDIALVSLNEFIKDHVYEDTKLWANGTKFDLGMIEEHMHSLGIRPAWPYNADRCMRTLKELVGRTVDVTDEDMAFYNHLESHDALYDAVWQAKWISKALAKIKII